MVNKKIIILLICIGFISCSQKDKTDIDKVINEDAYKKSEKLSDPFIGKTDTTFTNFITTEVYYKFHFLTDNTYQIIWGNRNFVSVSNTQFETYGNGNLSLIKYDDDYIILGQSTGSNSNIRVILPLKKRNKNMVHENVLYENLKETILLKSKNESNNLNLVDFKNNTSKLIHLSNLCPAADYTNCIDSISVIESELYIYYQGSNWNTNKSDNQVLKTSVTN